MEKQIFKELINHILIHGNSMNKERLDITVRFDYNTDDQKKNFISFSINSNIFKANNPGLSFMEQHNYFKTSKEMVKFFIEKILVKQVKLNTNKPFSKYTISLAQLNDIKTANLHIFLNEDLPIKKQKTIQSKI